MYKPKYGRRLDHLLVSTFLIQSERGVGGGGILRVTCLTSSRFIFLRFFFISDKTTRLLVFFHWSRDTQA
ncbi:hypothetical protein HanPI659440_Chr17g0685541 [Helianthus annuus]|uniref:Uncharacterized protein n=1 Tax=Helianthus annuus TaxID=4232 RepID=A0A251RQU9_HELAN|nr:hypothetical protein HanXRQr2_Chr17g0809091 [Helianthus annuus]KAJ0668130.1 hypothetical protein HanPI659440_Chr17g0685541 [Helianthus annuus]